jgi:IS5 family transposase
MIVNRYTPLNLFALVPQLTVEMDPVLAALDRLLEDDTLFTRVRHDLVTRFPQSATRGRHSTPVEVVLRMLVVRRLYDWSYEQTEYFVADSLVLRQFCRVYLERVPDDTTLIRWAQLIEPTTLDGLNEHVVALARQQRVTRGRKVRTDGTVVETMIRYPNARFDVRHHLHRAVRPFRTRNWLAAGERGAPATPPGVEVVCDRFGQSIVLN